MKYSILFVSLLLPYTTYANQTENSGSDTTLGIIAAIIIIAVIMAIKSFVASRKKKQNNVKEQKNGRVQSNSSSGQQAVKINESHLITELRTTSITLERANEIYNKCQTSEVETLAKQIIEKKKIELKQEELNTLLVELRDPHITLERLREIYDVREKDEAERISAELLKKRISQELDTMTPTSERLDVLYDLSPDADLDKRIESLLDERILKSNMEYIQRIDTIPSYSELYSLYEEADSDSFEEKYLFARLGEVAMIEVLHAEKILYNVSSPPQDRDSAIKIIDMLVEGVSCAAYTRATEIYEENYGEDYNRYQVVKNEILSGKASLERLIEIDQDDEISIDDDYIAELLSEQINARVLQEFICLAQKPIKELDHTYIVRMLEYPEDDSVAQTLGEQLVSLIENHN